MALRESTADVVHVPTGWVIAASLTTTQADALRHALAIRPNAGTLVELAATGDDHALRELRSLRDETLAAVARAELLRQASEGTLTPEKAETSAPELPLRETEDRLKVALGALSDVPWVIERKHAVLIVKAPKTRGARGGEAQAEAKLLADTFGVKPLDPSVPEILIPPEGRAYFVAQAEARAIPIAKRVARGEPIEQARQGAAREAGKPPETEARRIERRMTEKTYVGTAATPPWFELGAEIRVKPGRELTVRGPQGEAKTKANERGIVAPWFRNGEWEWMILFSLGSRRLRENDLRVLEPVSHAVSPENALDRIARMRATQKAEPPNAATESAEVAFRAAARELASAKTPEALADAKRNLKDVAKELDARGGGGARIDASPRAAPRAINAERTFARAAKKLAEARTTREKTEARRELMKIAKNLDAAAIR